MTLWQVCGEEVADTDDDTVLALQQLKNQGTPRKVQEVRILRALGHHLLLTRA